MQETLRQGLHGWQVTGCEVTMTHSGYAPRQSHAHAVFDKSMSSTAGDFRNLTPLVVMSALQEAGTRVHEPIHRFQLEIPADTFGAMMPVLARLRRRSADAGAARRLVRGGGCDSGGPGARPAAPAAGATRGEGVLESTFERYEAGRGETPTRPRTDDDPLDRRRTCCASCEGSRRVRRNVARRRGALVAARQGRRERPYADIWTRLRTPHRRDQRGPTAQLDVSPDPPTGRGRRRLRRAAVPRRA